MTCEIPSRLRVKPALLLIAVGFVIPTAESAERTPGRSASDIAPVSERVRPLIHVAPEAGRAVRPLMIVRPDAATAAVPVVHSSVDAVRPGSPPTAEPARPVVERFRRRLLGIGVHVSGWRTRGQTRHLPPIVYVEEPDDGVLLPPETVPPVDE